MGQEDLNLPASVMFFHLNAMRNMPFSTLYFQSNSNFILNYWNTAAFQRIIVLEHYRYAAYYQQIFSKIATSIYLHS